MSNTLFYGENKPMLITRKLWTKKPQNFEKMKTISQKLAKDMPFVRIDFYEIEGRLYFGEITFFPASGLKKFKPEKWNNIFGDMIDISKYK